MSEVLICNQALSRIGVSQTIQSLSEASQQAEMCNLWYTTLRDRILRSFPWGFAKSNVPLQDIGSPPENWSYRFRYPNDCLKIRSVVVAGTRTPNASQRIPYQVVEDQSGAGKAILCDIQAPEIEYTKRITDINLFSEEFKNILSWAIAIEVAMPLTGDAARLQKAQKGYSDAVLEAFAIDLNEQQEDVEPESSFIAARR